MADSEIISDDAIVLRHIPGGIQFQKPPDKPITSENFKPRPSERGISVSLFPPTTPEMLLARIGNPATGSRVAAGRVGDIRTLGLDVVRDEIDVDPGHTLIVPSANDFSSRTVRKQLANLFRNCE